MIESFIAIVFLLKALFTGDWHSWVICALFSIAGQIAYYHK